jgi:hypothetical protein
MESVHIVLDPILERTTNADRYEVKAAMGACFSPHRKKITRRVHEVSQFHVVDGLDGVHKGPLLPRPHLDENDSPFFHGYDVDLPHGTKEVPLEDAVAAETEVNNCRALTAGACAEVGRFSFEEHGGGDAREGPERKTRRHEGRSKGSTQYPESSSQ